MKTRKVGVSVTVNSELLNEVKQFLEKINEKRLANVSLSQVFEVGLAKWYEEAKRDFNQAIAQTNPLENS